MAISLRGRIQDITGVPVESSSRVIVKKPTAIGIGEGVITTQPALVDVAEDGGFTLSVEPGMGWLYIEDAGWSDSIPFVAAEGMTLFIEAWANATSQAVYTQIKELIAAIGGEAAALYAKQYIEAAAAESADAAAAIARQAAQQEITSAVAKLDSTVQWPKSELGAQDLNVVTTPGAYSQSSASSATQAANYPVASLRGVLEVLPTSSANRNMRIQRFTVEDGRSWTRRLYGSGNWSKWAQVTTFTGGDLGTQDLDSVLIPGSYSQGGADNATPERGYPVAERGSLIVLDPNPANANQKIQQYVSSQSNRIWIRNIYGSGNWSEWNEIGATREVPVGGIGNPYQHLIRERELRRRVGPIHTGGKAVVALVMDHGTKNFKEIVLPALRDRGLRVTFALNSNRLEPNFRHYASEGNIPWSEIKSWADEGVIEVANHSASHLLDSNDLQSEIIGSREFIESQIGRPVDSWVQPGLQAEGWGGFNNGIAPEDYYSTTAGAMILDGHAVVTGSIPDTDTANDRVYPVDGHIPIGMNGTWLDSGSESVISLIKQQIGQAVDAHGRYIVRFHPVSIDDGKQITSATLLSFLDWIQGEVDAGRIMVVPLREWAIAQR